MKLVKSKSLTPVFQLTKDKLKIWKSQNATSNSIKMGLRKLPLAFTEQGIFRW